MNLKEYSKNIILYKEEELIKNYKNSNEVYKYKIDKILENIIDISTNNKIVYEKYLYFLIQIGLELKKSEIDLIIKHSDILKKKTLSLSKQQYTILIVGIIYKIAEKEKLNVIFDINDSAVDDPIMRPSISKNKITGIICISNNLFDIKSKCMLLETMFILFHELGHLRELKYIYKYENELSKRYMKEFTISCTNNKLYYQYHDSFKMEQDADKYALICTYNLNKIILNNELENIKFIKKLYFNNRKNDIKNDALFLQKLNKVFSLGLIYNSDEIKELGNYMPILKKYIKTMEKHKKNLLNKKEYDNIKYGL